MDNILEILIPLIFAAVYFFGNMFSGKSKDEEDTPSGMSRRRESEGEDTDTADRQRRIQDEIRRKIMERRRTAEGGRAEGAPLGQKLRERRREVQAHLESRKETREVLHENREELPPPLSQSHEAAEPKSSTPDFSWDDSDNAYENSMQAQLSRIEETKRKAKKLEKQAAERSKSIDEGQSKRKRRTGGYFTGTVRESLTNPQAARVAFIYGEVLGQPISQRKNSTVPGLNQ